MLINELEELIKLGYQVKSRYILGLEPTLLIEFKQQISISFDKSTVTINRVEKQQMDLYNLIVNMWEQLPLFVQNSDIQIKFNPNYALGIKHSENPLF